MTTQGDTRLDVQGNTISARILPFLVLAQFLCTSLWFAGNGVMNELAASFQLDSFSLSYLTSAVQLGFMSGTLLLALLTVTDRFSPSLVFFSSAILGAAFNAGMTLETNTLPSLLFFRFFTGFSLAGIYPVGMKIASDYYDKGLGKSLGFLVGALVVGTAFPHLLKELTDESNWRSVLLGTSCLSVLGGSLVFVGIPNGPYRRPSQKIEILAAVHVFKNRDFRAAAIGYFGHMWELYAFWAFLPLLLQAYRFQNPDPSFSVPFVSFTVIAIGGVACVLAGLKVRPTNTQRSAFVLLAASAMCCVLSPVFFSKGHPFVVAFFLLFWGMAVVADSPLFSTLVAQRAPAENRGTALTIVTCIGFFITIVSIQLLGVLSNYISPLYVFPLLAAGPLWGLLVLRKS